LLLSLIKLHLQITVVNQRLKDFDVVLDPETELALSENAIALTEVMGASPDTDTSDED
jgi:hypothetical protein